MLDNDPFWGPSYAKEIEAKAAQLEQGLLQLIQQCCQLNDVVMAHDKSPSKGRRLGCVTPYHAHAAESDKTQASIVSKQQTKDMLLNEQGWMQKIVVGCWTTLLADAARAKLPSSCSDSELTGEGRRSFTS